MPQMQAPGKPGACICFHGWFVLTAAARFGHRRIGGKSVVTEVEG